MAVNEATLSLITEYEGWVPKWYRDPVGIWTCCYGHTDAAGDPTYAETKSKTFTKEEGRELLRSDLEAVEDKVRKLVKVPVDENQFGALVSFAYNVGTRAFADSTLLKKLNAGDYLGATQQFARWNKGGKPKKVLPGLTRRRAAEAALFAQPVSGTTTPATPTSPRTEQPASQGEGFQISWLKVGLIAAVLVILALIFVF